MTQAAVLGWMISMLLAVGCAPSNRSAPAQIHRAELEEPALMAKLRIDAKSAPSAALALAEDGERRFGDSPFAEERQALAIQALIDLDRIGAARSRAYQFLEHYPNGPYSAHIADMTGVHLTPRGPAASARP